MTNAAGIDVSVYQNPTPPLTGLSFVFARAGYGTSAVDKMYATHAANVRKAGLVLGAYWFWYDGQVNSTAVATFLATAGSADLLVLDLEGTNANTSSGQSQARDFIAKVHAAGHPCGLYHSISGYPQLGQDFDWVAYWSSTPPDQQTVYGQTHWTFWQNGTAGGIDHDYFNGDTAALAAFVGGLDMNAATQVPVADCTLAKTNVYADEAMTKVLINGYAPASTTAIDLYSKSATVAAIRLGLGAAPYTPTLCYVPVAAVSNIRLAVPDSTPYSAADLLAAKQAQYDLDAKSIAVSPTTVTPTAKLTNARPS